MLARRIRTDGFVDPCIPSRAHKPPFGPDWVHEVKHDGYRLVVRRDGPAVRLFTRRGYDWTDRYPAIANAAVAGGEGPYIMRRRIVGTRKGPVWGPSDCGAQND